MDYFIKVTLIFSASNEQIHVKSYQLLDVLYRNIGPSFTSKAFKHAQEVLGFVSGYLIVRSKIA